LHVRTERVHIVAAICCILFHNTSDEDSVTPDKARTPHPRRRWALQKEEFLRGLIACAGRRHALSILKTAVASLPKVEPREFDLAPLRNGISSMTRDPLENPAL
jgi:hypothetical protein